MIEGSYLRRAAAGLANVD